MIYLQKNGVCRVSHGQRREMGRDLLARSAPVEV